MKNDEIKKILFQSLDADVHILKGLSGLGIKDTGIEVARKALCLFPNTYDCTCESCNKFLNKAHPDFIYLTLEVDKKSIGVNEISMIIKEVFIRPLLSSHKVIFIEQAEKLTIQAQNKLLKTLEDSRDYIKFILVCSNDNLLPTIESRGMIWKFRPLSGNQIIHILEQYKLSDEDKYVLLSCSAGCPGTIEKLVSLPKCLNRIKNTLTSINKGNKKVFLESLGLLKEKDKRNICENIEELKYLLTAIEYLLINVIKHIKGCETASLVKPFITPMASRISSLQAYNTLGKVMEANASSKIISAENLISLCEDLI